MKSCVIVGFLVATLLQVEGRPTGSNTVFYDSIQQTADCRKQMGPEKIIQLPSFLPDDLTLPDDNSALNELIGCLWKKKGIIDEQSVLNEVKLKEYFVDMSAMFIKPGEEELMHEVDNLFHESVQKCKSIRGNDYGQTAIKVQNCIGTVINNSVPPAARGDLMGLTDGAAPTDTHAFTVIIVMLLYYFNNFFL